MKNRIVIALLAFAVSLSAVACASSVSAVSGSGGKAESAAVEEAKETDAEVPEDAEDAVQTDVAEEGTDAVADVSEDRQEITADENGVLSNGLFTITMPKETEGTYLAYATDNRISVFEKAANEAGFGGFTFSVEAYKEPSEYAGGMDMKVGEMTAADGTVYDVTRSYPSDMQWDYNKSEDMPAEYAALYDGAEDIIKTLSCDGGSFTYGAGTKGEDLYRDTLAQLSKAVDEKWDASKLEENDMSPMYFSVEKAGYAYRDVNHDGIDELLVGEITDGEMKGVIYDIYTMADRKPVHVLSGTSRDCYFVLDSGFIMNKYSGGAGMSGFQTYDIEPNTTNLLPQVGLKYDSYENEEKPWFVTYSEPEKEEWEGITEEEYNTNLERFENIDRIDFTPLTEAE